MAADAIDVHNHVVPDALPFTMSGDDRWPVFRRDGEHADVLVGGQVFRRVHRPAWDMAARLHDMDRDGIAVQALSPMPELFCYWSEPADGARWSSSVNRWIADACAGNPGRFVGLGTVPLQHVATAVELLDEVAELGLAGVQIGTNVGGELIAHPRYLPVLEAAAARGLCVFVHVFHPPYADCLVTSPAIGAGVTFPPEIGTCIAGLIANGAVERVPGLRLGASHGGGTLALHLPRLMHFWKADPSQHGLLPRSPYDYARTLWYDTLVYEPATLAHLIGIFGVDRMFVGSDYPFFDARPGWLIDELADLSDVDRSALRRDNAVHFLGLD